MTKIDQKKVQNEQKKSPILLDWIINSVPKIVSTDNLIPEIINLTLPI